MELERHAAGVEVRADGRTLSGRALSFGEISPDHMERFAPGSIDLGDGTVRWLDLEHDATRLLAWTGAGLELRVNDRAVEISATLPRTPLHDTALEGVRSGRYGGLSVEFHAEAERREDGIRVIEKAHLAGVGLVRSPSYPSSTVEARARRGPRRTWIRGNVRYGVKAYCACTDGSCNEVIFRPHALGPAVDADDVIATVGRATEAIASTKSGSMRLVDTVRGLKVEIMDNARDTAAGRQLQDLVTAGVDVYVRPLLDDAASEIEDETDGVRTYRRAAIKGLLVKPILDAEGERRDGWEPVEFEGTPPPRRRSVPWL